MSCHARAIQRSTTVGVALVALVALVASVALVR
jgi:hypothetical protein